MNRQEISIEKKFTMYQLRNKRMKMKNATLLKKLRRRLFILYKKNFYKKMTLKNPKTLISC